MSRIRVARRAPIGVLAALALLGTATSACSRSTDEIRSRPRRAESTVGSRPGAPASPTLSSAPAGPAPAPATAAPSTVSPAEPRFAALTIAPEAPRAGYDRSLFTHWTDDDGDGCDTRCEVLAAERRSDLPGLSGGWLSIYDGYTTDNPAELEIDHVVSLAEAWDSGAWAWDANRRRAFANDLGDPRTLIAVTAASNRIKSDRDPAEWQPSNRDSWCEYAGAWVAVKARWGLSADGAERQALENMLVGCPAWPLVTTLPLATTAGVPPAPTEASGAVYYANCTAARSAGVAPILAGSPGYRAALDRDGDGVACE